MNNRLFVVALLMLGSPVWAEGLDPEKLAAAVKKGDYQFNEKLRLTLTLANGQTYTITPVHPDHTYPMAPGVPIPPPPPPPRNGRPPPPKPPSPPPRPPPSPIPPTNERPPKPPRSLIEEFARLGGSVVASVETEGLTGDGWTVPKGRYTLVLMMVDDKPCAVWVSEAGKYVISSDNVYMAYWPH